MNDVFDASEPLPVPPPSPLPRMPPEIAQAIIKVMVGVRKIAFDESNEHAHYNYASIDAFLHLVNPLCGAAGLAIIIDEPEAEVRGGESGKPWLFPRYEIWLLHESGAMWGPIHRHLALPATGPQAFGAAESYALKRFMRGIFQIPTGEKDADDTAQQDIPRSPAQGRRTQRTPEAVPDSGKSVPSPQRPANAPAEASADVKEQARHAFRWLGQEIESAATVARIRELSPYEDDAMPAWAALKAGHRPSYDKRAAEWSVKRDRLVAMAEIGGGT